MKNIKKSKSLGFKPMEIIDKSKIPTPLTWHVLVQPYEPEEQTSGGLYLSEEDKKDYKQLQCVGKVIKMGPNCFDSDQFKGKRAFEEGDVVMFGRHNGMWFNWEGVDLVLLLDDRFMMKLDSEEQLFSSLNAKPEHLGSTGELD